MTGRRPDRERVSRRDFLFVAAVGGSAIAAVSLIPSRALAADKVSPKTVSYQPSPKGNQRCDGCQNFQSPASCKLVDGAISPSGWCTLFSARK